MTIPPSALKSSRAVLFEHDDEEKHSYYGRGSGLLFVWRRRSYFLTPKHVARQGGFDQLRILATQQGRDFLPFDHTFGIDGDDEDWKDLRLYRVAEDNDDSLWADEVLELDMAMIARGRSLFRQGSELVLSGYPDVTRDIDYEELVLKEQRHLIPARYDGPADGFANKHRIVLADYGAPSSYDGLSGSPVLAESPEGLAFMGTVIQGSAESGIVHIIDPAVLANMLRRLPT